MIKESWLRARLSAELIQLKIYSLNLQKKVKRNLVIFWSYNSVNPTSRAYCCSFSVFLSPIYFDRYGQKGFQAIKTPANRTSLYLRFVVLWPLVEFLDIGKGKSLSFVSFVMPPVISRHEPPLLKMGYSEWQCLKKTKPGQWQIGSRSSLTGPPGRQYSRAACAYFVR